MTPEEIIKECPDLFVVKVNGCYHLFLDGPDKNGNPGRVIPWEVGELLTEARQQLQALQDALHTEKDRADKAEEMVAGLHESSSNLLDGIWKEVDTFDLEKKLTDCIKNTKQTAQDHNKRLCDEIVERILDSSYGGHLLREAAIDIVKSVLGGEG